MLFPSFVDQWGGEGRSAVEAGEGHGPRKEFFLLVRTMSLSESSASTYLPNFRAIGLGGISKLW